MFNRSRHIALKKTRSRAQSMLEFVLLIPFLTLLIMGTLDFGQVISTKICLSNAAREGANYLSRNPSDQATGYAYTIAVIKAEGQNLNFSITDDEIEITNCCTVNYPVTVTVTKNVDLVFGSLLSALGIAESPLEVSSTVSMMVQ